MKYTKEMSFKEFLEAIWPGIKLSLILIIVLGVIGTLAASLVHEVELKEQHFYEALKGKEVNDSKILDTVSVAKQIYQGKFHEWTEPQWVNIYHILQGKDINYEKALNTKAIIEQIYEGKFQDWENLKDQISSSNGDQNTASIYFALKNWPTVKEYIENPAKEVPMKNSSKDYGDWLPGIILEIVFLLIPIAYADSCYDKRYRNGDKWWLYPWGKWWAYPAVLIMIPFIVITQPYAYGHMIVERAIEKKLENHNIALLMPIEKSEERLKAFQTKAKKEGIPFVGEDVKEANDNLSEARKAYYAKNYQYVELFQKRIDGYLNRIQAKLDRYDHRNEEYEKKIKEVMEGKKESRDKFGRIRESELVSKQARIADDISCFKRTLSDLGDKIEKNQRELALKMKEAKEIKKIITNGNDQDFLRQFDEISALPLVKAIEVGNKEIKVFTDTIYIIYRGDDEFFKGKYEIGSFMIKFEIGGYGVQEIKNLANTSIAKEGHPYGDGSYCFGNLSDYIHKALKEKNFVLATLLVLQSLQTGEGDHPEKLKYWKKVY